MAESVQRELGQIQSDINYLKDRDTDFKKDLDTVKQDLSDIKRTLNTVGSLSLIHI